MRDICFSTPTKLYFGKTANCQIGNVLKQAGARKILVVTGGSSGNQRLNELYTAVCAQIRQQSLVYTLFSGVKPNPTLTGVREGIAVARQEQVDVVVAIGGGSVIDTAKGIAAGALYDGDVWDFYQGTEKIQRALPVYVVLTLSGTGSENNGNSVISDKEKGIKKLLISNFLYPKAAFIDPTVQETVPARLFTAGCIDAMCHIMEHYFDGGDALAISDAMAEALLRTLMEKAPQVLADPTDYESRCAVMWATSLALNGVPSIIGLGGKGGDWSSHNLETGLSILKGTTHGIGLGILFPAWLDYVKSACMEKAARFSREVCNVKETDDEKAAAVGIARLKSFFVEIGCPGSLRELGVKAEELETCADIISVFLPMGRVCKIKNIDVAKILQQAF